MAEGTLGHRLSEKDFDKGTATCAVCGPVKMRSRGKGRPACAVSLAARHRRYVERNPQQARRNRRSASRHRLVSFDVSTHTGECPVCGTVGVVAKGRGWMCRTRAEELWVNQQEVPQSRCGVCSKAWLLSDGTCPYCSDRAHKDLSVSMRADQDLADLRQWVDDWCEDIKPLETVIDERTHNPYSVDGDTIANPAIRTIGSGVPDGLTASRFIARWWAQNQSLVEGGE